ncbi:MAG: isochorismatase family protein [Pseudomonadota bacterium]|nr:isochorismatase family protein [Pseudomonadota bacterium]
MTAHQTMPGAPIFTAVPTTKMIAMTSAAPDHYDQTTALIVVDVQNDFADPAGHLYVPGGEQVIDPINRQIRAARKAGALVVYTRDWHPADTPHFASHGGIWPDHCVRDSWGAAFHSGLIVEGEVVSKGTGSDDGYSGFRSLETDSGTPRSTGLEEHLRAANVERLVVVGLATDYCVKATVLDAAAKGFQVTVLTTAIRAVDLKPGDGDAALKEMAAEGATIR